MCSLGVTPASLKARRTGSPPARRVFSSESRRQSAPQHSRVTRASLGRGIVADVTVVDSAVGGLTEGVFQPLRHDDGVLSFSRARIRFSLRHKVLRPIPKASAARVRLFLQARSVLQDMLLLDLIECLDTRRGWAHGLSQRVAHGLLEFARLEWEEDIAVHAALHEIHGGGHVARARQHEGRRLPGRCRGGLVVVGDDHIRVRVHNSMALRFKEGLRGQSVGRFADDQLNPRHVIRLPRQRTELKQGARGGARIPRRGLSRRCGCDASARPETA